MVASSPNAGQCAVAVMAKTPTAGRSKTRLTPPLTPAQAAALSAAFLSDVTETMARAARQRPIARWAAYAPAGPAHAFDGMLAEGTRLLLADGATDVPPGVTGFGRCLFHAMRTLLSDGYAAACVLNSDSPTLPARILCQAADLLLAPGDRAVIGPAEDGGYYLLGLKSAHARLFTDIAWSTDGVAEATRERARQTGLELVELPPWYDVDDAASLDRLRRDLSRSGSDAAPASARALAVFVGASVGTGT